MGTSPSHAAGLTCTCPRAGAPIPVAYAQAPGLPGYARYPCIDAPARSDFPAGCPAAVNLTRYGLAANPGRACWVNGTLAVRLSTLTLPYPCAPRQRSRAGAAPGAPTSLHEGATLARLFGLFLQRACCSRPAP